MSFNSRLLAVGCFSSPVPSAVARSVMRQGAGFVAELKMLL